MAAERILSPLNCLSALLLSTEVARHLPILPEYPNPQIDWGCFVCGIASRIDLERKNEPVTRFHRIGKETCAMYEQQQHVDK